MSSVIEAILEPSTRLRMSVASGSVSLAMTSVVTEAFSVVDTKSGVAVGASFSPVTVIVSVPSSVAPLLSLTV